ncbi:MAG: phage antirepressor N-terminal domain-containing protein, partial [Ktedonobacteraceae bacterium]
DHTCPDKQWMREKNMDKYESEQVEEAENREEKIGAIVPQTIREVDFYGDELIVAISGNEAYVVLRPIVQNLGVDWSSQRRRTLRDAILAEEVRQMVWTSADGKQREMMALPLNLIAGWLFGFTPNKQTKPEQVEKITRYRKRCFEVLWHAVQSGEMTTGITHSLDLERSKELHPRAVHSKITYEDLEQTIVLEPEAATILPGPYEHLFTVLTLVREHLEILFNLVVPVTDKLNDLAVQLSTTDTKIDQVLALLYQLAGQQEQQQQRLDKIDERTKRLTPKHERAVADLVEDIIRRTARLDIPLDHFKIYGQLKHKFAVHSFKEIDDDRFESVMEFLRNLQSKALGGNLPQQERLL